jgi:hypothetical protein
MRCTKLAQKTSGANISAFKVKEHILIYNGTQQRRWRVTDAFFIMFLGINSPKILK